MYIIEVLVLLLWRMTWCSVSYTIISVVLVRRWWRCRVSTFTSRSISEILEITWIVGLVVQESLSFKEVFPPLECTLLLHLLERILIVLKNISCVFVHVFYRACVVCILVFEIGWTVILWVWTVAISRWTSIWHRNTINILPHKCIIFVFFWTSFAAAAWHIRWHIEIHISTMTYRRWWIAMYTMSLWWFIFSIEIHLSFQFVH